MIRSNHYEVAFEEYLRACRVPYVAVDETRRAVLDDASLKSMDFIVYSAEGDNLLVDVKGKRRKRGRRWDNWAMREDIEALLQWQKVFGPGFRSILVFAYESPVCSNDHASGQDSKVFYSGSEYEFVGVWVDEYQEAMKLRSPSWQTVWLPAKEYEKRRFLMGQLFTESIVV